MTVRLWRAAVVALLWPACASAQEGGLSIELNRAEPVGPDCRMTFVLQNGTGGDLVSAAYEVAVQDVAGQVAQLVVMDFGPLVAGRMRVVQFDIPAVTCDEIGRLSVNDPAVRCGAAAGSVGDACSMRSVRSRAAVALE